MAAIGEELSWTKEALIVLTAAGVVVPLFHRLKLGVTLGFLIVGVVIGPFGLGRLTEAIPLLDYVTITEPEKVRPLAELGVLFLLFMLGMEISLKRLWQLRRYVLGVGSAQVFTSALLIFGTAYAFGNPPTVALVLSLCLALSSTAIVMQLLLERRRLGTPVARLALSVLLFQDLMVVPILIVVGILGAGGTESVWSALARAFVVGALVVAAILIAGRFVLRPVLTSAVASGSRDLVMAIALLAVAATAAITSAAGLSLALGAFIAGLLLSESEYRHQIEVDIEPFKGLLLGLFFMTVGMSVDFGPAIANAGWVLASVAGLVLFKGALIYGICRVFGTSRPVAFEGAILLAGAGEFAFVVVALAQTTGIMPAETGQFMIVVAGLSMMATPFLARFAENAGQRIASDDSHRAHGMADDEMEEMQGHVVIGGFGRVGQTIARILDQETIPYVAFDSDGGIVAKRKAEGDAVYFGDASRIEILEKAGFDRAGAFIVTMDAADVAERMVQTIQNHRPDAMIFARAKDRVHARRLAEFGARDVFPETMEASLQLAGQLLEALGLPEDAVLQRLSVERETEAARMNLPS